MPKPLSYGDIVHIMQRVIYTRASVLIVLSALSEACRAAPNCGDIANDIDTLRRNINTSIGADYA